MESHPHSHERVELFSCLTDGVDLFRVTDFWRGDKKAEPKLLLENAMTGEFAWHDSVVLSFMERVDYAS